MRNGLYSAIVLAYCSIVICLVGISAAAADARPFETADTTHVADVIPDELRIGEHYAVDDQVQSDGYLHYYKITSDFGEFSAVSTATLRIRVREIAALAELDDLSKTEVFIKAAADAGVGQIKSLTQFAAHPVESVIGIPSGIGRMFKRYKRQAGDAADATKEYVSNDDDGDGGQDDEEAEKSNVALDVTEGFFGVSSAERAWSHQLGTDPYSKNETLRAAIKSVAWADRIGRFGVKFAPIPSIPGASIIGDVNEVVWSKDPYELQDLNRSRLVSTGADDALIEEYLDNSRISPSQQTLLTAAIAEMADVGGRSGILRQALNPLTDAEIEFFLRSVTMLSWYHLNQNAIKSVNTEAAIPVGIKNDQSMVLMFAVDHVYWTESVANSAANYAQLLSSDEERRNEIWFLGTTSARCKEELELLGLDVHQNLAPRMESEDG